jgi:hypothetical protein
MQSLSALEAAAKLQHTRAAQSLARRDVNQAILQSQLHSKAIIRGAILQSQHFKNLRQRRR